MRLPLQSDHDELMWNAFWQRVLQTAFHVSVTATIVFALLDVLANGFVRYFFPLGFFPWSVAITGTALLLVQKLPAAPFSEEAEHRPRKSPRVRWLRKAMVVVFAAVGGLLIAVQTDALGAYRWGIAAAAAVIIALVGLLEGGVSGNNDTTS